MKEPTVELPADPHEWRPMRPYRGRRTFEITDPIVEPLWSGVRILAHVDTSTDDDANATVERARPRVAMIEDLGAELADELPELAAAIGRSVMALDAVIDGVITRQVGLDGIGAAAIPEVRASASGLLMRNKADLDVVPRGTTGDGDEVSDGFIAVDLLRVDGTSLIDVPLLERKRLLESVVEPSDLVRTSIHVRPPLETWIATWKSVGLRGGMLKAANSHYRPGHDTIEWRQVESVGRRG